jgi:hypothetical protein
VGYLWSGFLGEPILGCIPYPNWKVDMTFWSDDVDVPDLDPRTVRCLHDGPDNPCMSAVGYQPSTNMYICPRCLSQWGKKMLDGITVVEREAGNIPVVTSGRLYLLAPGFPPRLMNDEVTVASFG